MILFYEQATVTRRTFKSHSWNTDILFESFCSYSTHMFSHHIYFSPMDWHTPSICSCAQFKSPSWATSQSVSSLSVERFCVSLPRQLIAFSFFSFSISDSRGVNLIYQSDSKPLQPFSKFSSPSLKVSRLSEFPTKQPSHQPGSSVSALCDITESRKWRSGRRLFVYLFLNVAMVIQPVLENVGYIL